MPLMIYFHDDYFELEATLRYAMNDVRKSYLDFILTGYDWYWDEFNRNYSYLQGICHMIQPYKPSWWGEREEMLAIKDQVRSIENESSWLFYRALDTKGEKIKCLEH